MNHCVASEPSSSLPAALGCGRHHIDAGLQIAERLVDRERGGDVLVQRGRGREFAGPDLDAALVAEIARARSG